MEFFEVGDISEKTGNLIFSVRILKSWVRYPTLKERNQTSAAASADHVVKQGKSSFFMLMN